jgi:hypothetical protein
MNSTQASIASAFTRAILAYSLAVSADAAEASQDKAETLPSGRERGAAVIKILTNGTPMSAVIAHLGTNYEVRSISVPGPLPRDVSALIYQFGDREFVIASTAATNANPIDGAFIFETYLRPGTHRDAKNRLHIGEQEGVGGARNGLRATFRCFHAGEVYEFTITEERQAQCPKWDPEKAENPPVPAAKALAKAKDYFATIKLGKGYSWEFEDLSMVDVYGWVWRARFHLLYEGGWQGPPHIMECWILMDGTVVKPLVTLNTFGTRW